MLSSGRPEVAQVLLLGEEPPSVVMALSEDVTGHGIGNHAELEGTDPCHLIDWFSLVFENAVHTGEVEDVIGHPFGQDDGLKEVHLF